MYYRPYPYPYLHPYYPMNYAQPYEQVQQYVPDSRREDMAYAVEEQEERLHDYGGRPYVVDIKRATERNQAFRRTIWTGEHFQITLMHLQRGEDIGLEIHPHTDQFLRVESGHGIVQMGDRRDQMNFERRISENDAIIVPAGKWHNLRNTGRNPLKLYSIYAPPEHPSGTVHQTKHEAMEAEHH